MGQFLYQKGVPHKSGSSGWDIILSLIWSHSTNRLILECSITDMAVQIRYRMTDSLSKSHGYKICSQTDEDKVSFHISFSFSVLCLCKQPIQLQQALSDPIEWKNRTKDYLSRGDNANGSLTNAAWLLRGARNGTINIDLYDPSCLTNS